MLTTLALTLTLAMSGDAPKPGPTNTICPVLGYAVTPGKSPVVTVRGHQYYLCCSGCDAKLAKNPDQYLEKDGTPKNAKAEQDHSMHHH